MEYIYEFGLFLAQAVTLVAAVLMLVAGLVAIGQRQKLEQHEGHIEIRSLNDKYRHIGDTIDVARSMNRDYGPYFLTEEVVLGSQDRTYLEMENNLTEGQLPYGARFEVINSLYLFTTEEDNEI